jgi:hypothetical protein
VLTVFFPAERGEHYNVRGKIVVTVVYGHGVQCYSPASLTYGVDKQLTPLTCGLAALALVLKVAEHPYSNADEQDQRWPRHRLQSTTQQSHNRRTIDGQFILRQVFPLKQRLARPSSMPGERCARHLGKRLQSTRHLHRDLIRRA